MFVLLGSENANAFPDAQAMKEHFIGIDIQSLLHFPLYIRLPVRAEQVRKARLADLGLDHFGRKGDSREQPGEFARSGRMPLLALENMLLNGDNRLVCPLAEQFRLNSINFHIVNSSAAF